MNAIHKRRLEKLAHELRTRIPRKVFNFEHWTFVPEGGKPPAEALKAGDGCGTVGCAIGWCPAIFPRSWEWTNDMGNVQPALREGGDITLNGAEVFFGLSYAEASFLFTPNDSLWVNEKMIPNRLRRDSSPVEVARNIERFLKLKANGKKP